jgi:hypothetical protein
MKRGIPKITPKAKPRMRVADPKRKPTHGWGYPHKVR